MKTLVHPQLGPVKPMDGVSVNEVLFTLEQRDRAIDEAAEAAGIPRGDMEFDQERRYPMTQVDCLVALSDLGWTVGYESLNTAARFTGVSADQIGRSKVWFLSTARKLVAQFPRDVSLLNINAIRRLEEGVTADQAFPEVVTQLESQLAGFMRMGCSAPLAAFRALSRGLIPFIVPTEEDADRFPPIDVYFRKLFSKPGEFEHACRLVDSISLGADSPMKLPTRKSIVAMTSTSRLPGVMSWCRNDWSFALADPNPFIEQVTALAGTSDGAES